MKTDELAFFNQQLALMLRDGIPLEGALKELTRGMRRGDLRGELEALETDLGKGTPLAEAISRRKLPDFYKRMVVAGAAGNDLPGMLTLLADHYHRAHALWIRLKGLMTYPLVVIMVSFGLTLLLAFVFRGFIAMEQTGITPAPSWWLVASLWISPAVLALAAATMIAGLTLPGMRTWLRWRMPAFREASLAQLASAMALMLRQGTALPDALALAASLESGTPAGRALEHWRARLARGEATMENWGDATQGLPPLFTWLVRSSREDPAAGFQKAADIYQSRANYRTELMLYGALPLSILLLAQLVFWQIAPVIQVMLRFMNTLGDMGNF